MGLTAKTQAAIAKALSGSLSDAVTDNITLTLHGGSTYDENTQSVVYTDTSEVVRGVFVAFDEKELRDSAIINTDDKLIILQNELDMTPVVDLVVTAPGYTATVMRVTKDPAGVIWELQCRK